jgi:hypothetical protein
MLEPTPREFQAIGLMTEEQTEEDSEVKVALGVAGGLCDSA